MLKHHRRSPRVAFCILTAVGCGLGAPSAKAQIVVGDGDDLMALVGGAARDQILRIDSNDTFKGTLLVGNSVTIEAGPGFAPIIEGNDAPDTLSPGLPALSYALSSEDSVVTLIGLTLRGGLNGETPGRVAERMSGLIVNDNGSGSHTLTVADSVVEGVQFSLTGDTLNLAVGFENNRLRSTGEQPALAWNSADSTVGSLTLASNRIEGLDAILIGSSSLDVTAINNVFSVAPGVTTGIRLSASSDQSVAGRFVNNTIVGFDTGIERGQGLATGDVTFENMLLDNADDLVGVELGDIQNSLISDGTFDGQSGNFGGVPTLGNEQELLPVSLGIDAGSNTAEGIPETDISGAPRIQDGNDDSIAVVDVGAFEADPVDLYTITLLEDGVPIVTTEGVHPLQEITPPPTLDVIDEYSITWLDEDTFQLDWFTGNVGAVVWDLEGLRFQDAAGNARAIAGVTKLDFRFPGVATMTFTNDSIRVAYALKPGEAEDGDLSRFDVATLDQYSVAVSEDGVEIGADKGALGLGRLDVVNDYSVSWRDEDTFVLDWFAPSPTSSVVWELTSLDFVSPSGQPQIIVGVTKLDFDFPDDEPAISFTENSITVSYEALEDPASGDASGFDVILCTPSEPDDPNCDGGVETNPFRRGDCDGDGNACSGVSDALELLSWLFLGNDEPLCRAACDPDGDGDLELADAIYGLNFCFAGTEPPAAPFPDCGAGTEGDAALGCETSNCP